MASYVAIIDGTGDFSNASYAASMAHSFCKQMDGAAGDATFYQRGPSNDGLSVKSKAESAASWLIERYRYDMNARIYLAGYSRGASAAVMAAEILEHTREQISVSGLFLFDAVARHIYSGGEVIPGNVEFAAHAMRTDDPAFVKKYAHTIGLLLGNPARPSFGHTATTTAWGGFNRQPVIYEQHVFTGSHGALGGVGWPHVTEDPDCQEQVARWMNIRLSGRGLRGALRSVPPRG
jgi:hypothetical protein